MREELIPPTADGQRLNDEKPGLSRSVHALAVDLLVRKCATVRATSDSLDERARELQRKIEANNAHQFGGLN